jgi:myosin-5
MRDQQTCSSSPLATFQRAHAVWPAWPGPIFSLQLCEGASEQERSELRLRPAKQFRYLNQSACFDLRGVSNAEEYRRTRRSMSVVGIPEAEQDAVFRTVAAVLHLGNLAFVEAAADGADASELDPAAQEHLEAAAVLLGADAEGLRRALTTRTRQTPDGPIVSPIDVKAAQVYVCVFVGRVSCMQ